MKTFLACLIGAVAIGALWEAVLHPWLGMHLQVGSARTSAILLASTLVFVGSLWGVAAKNLFKTKTS